MMLPKALLDTDIISVLSRERRYRRHPSAVARAAAYETVYKQFTISIITRYEVVRGLKAKGSTTQSLAFEQFCQANEVLPLTDEIVVQAANVYADLKRLGNLIGDVDILIAATALVHGLTLVTNNEKHYSRIAGLQIDNWLK